MSDEITYEDLDDYQQTCYDHIKQNVERFLDPVPFTQPDKLAAFCSGVKPPPRRTIAGARFEFRFRPAPTGTYIYVYDLREEDRHVDLTMNFDEW